MTAVLIAIVVLAAFALMFYARAEASFGWSKWLEALGTVGWLAAFAIVGALVVSHRSGNVVGWLCLAFSFIWAIWSAGDSLLLYNELHPGTLQNPGLVAALIHPLWVPGIALVGLLMLLFPDGKVPSPRWRPVLWGLLVVTAVLTVTEFFLPGVVQERTVVNPFGIDAFEVFAGPVGLVLVVPLIGGILLSAVSVVFRYRQADQVERLQLKWLTAAAVVSACCYALLFTRVFGELSVQLIFSLIPISIWIAIRRHRLYEIDRLISRTVAYATVVVILGVVYLGFVFVLQDLLPGDDSLAVAASTLVVAAIFNLLRRRVLAQVDRFFNRSHYDAERVVEVFTDGLRDETDADLIVRGWMGVVSETMEPVSVGVWTR